VAVAVAYPATFVVLWPFLGMGGAMLGVIPAALAGWVAGPLGGVGAVIGLMATNAVLVRAVVDGADRALWGAAVRPSTVLGVTVLSVVAVGAGLMRRRQQELEQVRAQLQEQLAEHEALTAAVGESEERFRLLSEEALTGVYLVQDGVLQYVNPALARTFGYDVTEIIGRLAPTDLTHPQDRDMVREHLEARLQRGSGVAHYRFRGRRKDGSLVPVEVHGRALTIDGRLSILGTLRDRSVEAKAEAELHLRLKALQAAPTGIVVTTTGGVIEWANPHALALTGYTLNEVKGQHTRLFRSGHHDAATYERLWGDVTAGRVWSGEMINRRKDGSEYVEEMTITPVRGADGEIEHFVAAKTDVTERRDAEHKIRALNTDLQVQLERITALHDIDQAITQGFGLRDAQRVFLLAARSGLGVDAVALFRPLEQQGGLAFRGSVALRTLLDSAQPIKGAGILGSVRRSGKARMVRGAEAVRAALEPCGVPSLLEEGFEMVAAAPMQARGEMRGVVMVGHRSRFAAEDGWLEYLQGVAMQGAIMLDSAALVNQLRASNQQLEAAYDATIEGWSRALDLRDRETEGHSRRVTQLTLRLARAMGYPEERLEHVRRGALLHDIGKMGVPDAILQKPGPLSDEEWTVMRMHTTLARDLLAPIAFLQPAIEIPYAHHERWDGTGYPNGSRGEEIPLSARIFAVADVYDALTSDRPYRKAWSREETLQHIGDGAGSHFDPEVVAAFRAMERHEG